MAVTRLGRSQPAYDRFASAVDLPLTVLSALWLPMLVIPMVVHSLSAGARDTMDTIDYVVWAVFTVEYGVKLYLSPNRWRFVRTHVLDLVVIAAPMLRSLRAARLLRFVRLGRAGLILTGVLRRLQAILTHKGLHFVLLAVVGIVAVAAALEVMFEANAAGSTIHTYGQALWWSVVTITTVGYGDMHPVTAAGQGIAVVLMITGIGLLGVLTATFASYFVEQKRDNEKSELNDRLDRIEHLLAAVLAAREG